MTDKHRLSADFSAAADQYDDHAVLQKEVRAVALDVATTIWNDGAAILDLGCGTGAFAREAKELGMNWNITGADIAPGMCEIASSLIPTFCTSSESLPFKDESFDGVFSSLMLQWLANPAPTFHEIHRILKPGGRAILTTFTSGTLTELTQSLAAAGLEDRVLTFLAPMEITATAAHAGFSLLQAEEDEYRETYTELGSLLAGIRVIGASSKKPGRGLLTPRKLGAVNAYYHKHFTHKKHLVASWHVLTMMLEKKA